MTPTELTARYVAAFNDRDPDMMWEMVHPSVRYQIGGNEPTTGIQEVQQFYEPLLASDMQAQTYRSLEQGNTVFVETRLSGIGPRGETYVIEAAVRQRWSDGLLIDYRSYADPPVVDGVRMSFDDFLAVMSAH